MEHVIRAEKPLREVLERVGIALRERGWEVLQQADLASQVPGMEGPYFLLEALHRPTLAQVTALAPWAGLLCIGRLILYEEGGQTWVALLDTGYLASLLPESPLRQTVAESWEELIRLLEEVGLSAEKAQAPGMPDESVLRRLSRIEGQIRGLQKMLAENRGCEAILTQLAAVNGALKQVAASLLSTYLIRCVREDLEQGGDGSTVNRKLLSVLF